MKMLLLLRAADGAGLEAVMMSCAGRGKVARVSSTTKLITVRTYESVYDVRVRPSSAALLPYCSSLLLLSCYCILWTKISFFSHKD